VPVFAHRVVPSAVVAEDASDGARLVAELLETIPVPA
jgi:hypothetical protein